MNSEPPRLLGLRTAIYGAPDLEAAKAFYSHALGQSPYFDEPFYVGYNVAGFELGLDPDLAPAEGTPTTYWGVAAIRAAWAHWQAAGATPVAEPQDVGGGIWVATLRDPFGNTLGIIENLYFGQ